MRLPRLTTRGQSFLAAGTAIGLVGVVLGFPDITRIGALLGALPLLALLAGWRRTPVIAVRRTVFPTLLRPGEHADVHLDIRNTGENASVLQLAEERLDPRLGRSIRLVVPDMRPGEHHQVVYRVGGDARGGYRVGPLVLTQEDAFRLTHSRLHVPTTAEVVVLPRIEDLDLSGLRRLGVPGEGSLPQSVGSQGEDDQTTRSYREGDDLRRIHWPATAHRGELMVRQEERHARRRAVLLLDQRTGFRGDAFEWAVSALASAAVLLDRSGAGLLLVTAETLQDGIAGRTLPLDAVLRQLALVTSDGGDLGTALSAAHRAAAGTTVAAVSGHDPGALTRLATARRPGGAGVVLLAPGADGERTVAHFRAAGWHAHAAGADEGVRAAWDAALRAGAGPSGLDVQALPTLRATAPGRVR